MSKRILCFVLTFIMFALSSPSAIAIEGRYTEEQSAVLVEKSSIGSYTVTIDDSYFANADMTIAALRNGDPISVISQNPEQVVFSGQGIANSSGELIFKFFPREGIDLSQGIYIAVGSNKNILFGEEEQTIPYIIARANYTISVNCGANGSVSPSTVQTVEEGDTVTYTVTPYAGYVIDSLFYGDTPVTVNASNQYTTPAITENKTLSVTFKKDNTIPTVIIPTAFVEDTINITTLANIYSMGFNKEEVSGKPGAIAYAKYTGGIDECGMVFSSTNSNPVVGATDCTVAIAVNIGNNGAYLIYFYGKDERLSGNSYYVRSYAKYNDEYVYSDNVNTFTLNPVTE